MKMKPGMTRRLFLAASVPLFSVRQGARAEVRSERVDFADPLTERKMSRMTDPAILHHLPDYHHRFISKKNSFLLAASERTGFRQIFRMELPGGKMEQITEGAGIHSHSPTLDRKEKNFFYLQRQELKQARVKGGKEKTLYVTPRGWRPTGALSVSADDSLAALIEMRAKHWVGDDYLRQLERRPRCRLVVVDLATGRSRVVADTRHWLSHPQFRPGGRDILYVREGPPERVDEPFHLVSSGGKKRKSLRKREGAEQLLHPYWSPGGRVCYVHYPDESLGHSTLRCLDPESGAERTISRCSGFGWLSGNADHSAIAGASRRPSGPNVYVLFTRLQREVTLAEHASSLRPYPVAGTDDVDFFASRPEPAFSPDSLWVYFVTDREGKPALYQMRVEDLVEETDMSRAANENRV